MAQTKTSTFLNTKDKINSASVEEVIDRLKEVEKENQEMRNSFLTIEEANFKRLQNKLKQQTMKPKHSVNVKVTSLEDDNTPKDVKDFAKKLKEGLKKSIDNYLND